MASLLGVLKSKAFYTAAAITVAGVAFVAAVKLPLFPGASQLELLPGDAFDGTPKPGHTYFFSVGDFGVMACELAYKAGELDVKGGIGHGDCFGDKQRLVAESMARLAAALRPEFVLSLGDNFYVRGVRSLEDSQFNVSFEDMYSRGALAEVPWKITLGDHDHRGNVSALLLHSRRSRRWGLEAPYYGHRLPRPQGGGPGVELLVLDSVGLEGGVSPSLLPLRRFAEDYSDAFAGPEPAAEQWRWLEGQLSESQGSPPALYLVAAHRPVLSMVNRSRTEAERVVEADVRKLLFGASRRAPVVFMNGHDHALQLLSERGGRLHYVGNGAGGMGLHTFLASGTAGAPTEQFVWGETSSYGFVVHELGPDFMALHFVDAATDRVLRSARVRFAP